VIGNFVFISDILIWENKCVIIMSYPWID